MYGSTNWNGLAVQFLPVTSMIRYENDKQDVIEKRMRTIEHGSFRMRIHAKICFTNLVLWHGVYA